MPTYRTQWCWQAALGSSKDMYCNQFFFFHPTLHMTDIAGGTTTWGESIHTSFWNAFWNLEVGGVGSILQFLSKRVEGGYTWKVYDTANPLESPPVYTHTGFPPAGVIQDIPQLPEEVAVCLSYTANNIGSNIRRRRGRIYVGPLNMNAVSQGSPHEGPVIVDADLMAILGGAAVAFANVLAENGWKWRVFSKMDGSGFDISDFQVDNAFDTIRGRGVAPSQRNNYPVA